MSLRKARRGPREGEQFWVCSRHRDGCKKVIPSRDMPSWTLKRPGLARRARIPVAWMSARHSHTEEYATVGATPGCIYERLEGDARVVNALAQCVLIYDDGRARDAVVGESMLAGAMLLKVLQRGRTPLPTLGVEREALRRNGILADAVDLESETRDTGWSLPAKLARGANIDAVLGYATRKSEFTLDPAFDFDDDAHGTREARDASPEGLGSTAEADFLKRWVPEHLGLAAAHWFTPQAPLGDLLTSRGAHSSGDARRVDFLFCHPGGEPFVVEIDGDQHADAVAIDDDRDESLKRVGIDVIRVSTQEVERGWGASLDRILGRCKDALEALPRKDDRVAAMAVDCATAAKVQFALARAITFGWLTGGRQWQIDLAGAGSASVAGIGDALSLLAAFDVLYGARSVPTVCSVTSDDGDMVSYAPDAEGQWVTMPTNPTAPTEEVQRLRLCFEGDASPFHQLPSDAPDILIRPANLPIALASTQSGQSRKSHVAKSSRFGEGERTALLTFLRHLYRKAEFRQMQAEALFGVLQGKDLVVLLPTGAGKSLIYQMAGLLTPGMTLIVDPLVALMEDQIEGLRRCGIDRAEYIAMGRPVKAQLPPLLNNIEKGQVHFLFVAPERLQSPTFRETLRSLVVTAPINLAVIDEAHCVSEWGHEFRPAYLSLGKSLRTLCTGTSGSAPPLLALTGTASRTVLRDMLIDLDIGQRRSDALVRPETFDRKELEFEIIEVKESVNDPSAALRGILNRLPSDFNVPSAQFFRTARHKTKSGIVFVPHVNGSFGLHSVAAIVKDATNRSVGIYSGSPPKGDGDWDKRKRENARAFKANEVTTLVSTKAFGMGIDKPNIRYTIHVGLPTSIEQWYQEAGRAGRDKEHAKCKVLFFEYDKSRTDRILSQDVDFHTARTRYAEINSPRTRDDVTRALYFHFGVFQGADDDMDRVRQLLAQLGDLSVRQTVEVPFGSDPGLREVAVYRLLRVKVIDDYQVDFGAKKFLIDTSTFVFERSRQALLDYVAEIQPARASGVERELGAIHKGNALESAEGLAYVLVGFTYDLIERSRRSMLRSAVELAREAKEHEQIRRRLLDYLQEGIGAEAIDNLLEERRDIDFEGW